MCKIVDVAVYIVNRCIELGISIDYLKVQKLAYLCQGEHLRKYDVPLAPEDVLNWSCGAGFKEIFTYFRKNELMDDSIKKPIVKDLDLFTFEKETIHEVIDKYGNCPFEDLKTLRKYPELDIGEVVPKDVIKKVFQLNFT